MSTDIPVSETNSLPKPAKGSRRWLFGGLAAFIVIGTTAGFEFVKFRTERSVIKTDDAVSVTDVQDVMSGVDGQVQQIYVKPGDRVRQGQLLAVIANPELQASYTRAVQDVAAAQNQDSATQATIVPPSLPGNIGFGPLPGPDVKLKPLPPVMTAPHETPKTANTAPAGNSTIPSPETVQIDLLKSNLAKDQQKALKAADSSRLAESDVEAAQSSYQAIILPIDSLKSAVDFAKTKRDKFQGLYNDGIISRAEFQQKQSELDQAQSTLDQANQNAATAEDALKAKQAAFDSAKRDEAAATALVDKDQQLIAKAPTAPPVQSVPTPPKVAETTPPPLPHFKPFKPALPNFLTRRKNLNELPHFGGAAPMVPVKVAFSPDKHVTAETKLQVAQRTLKEIEVKLRALQVHATADGAIADIKFVQGQKVSATSVLATIMRPASQRVIASFNHSQALRIQLGAPCDVEFPNFPNRKFSGTVTRFLEAGNGVKPAQVEILLPESATTLAMLAPGTKTSVQVHRNG